MTNEPSVWIQVWNFCNGMAIASTVLFCADDALAQRRPIPDDTLGEERSIVTPLDPDTPVDVIEGGAERGDNLFHSFREFHVDEGRGVYFDDRGFANIISRVTGGITSRILGVLGALGDANLFLINPNGIIFGPDARLDVGGSFIATTANAIQFGEQGFFSASEMNAPPLLTVQPSAFLFDQIAAQPINSIENRGALRVPDNESLLLVGGNVSPTVTATGGILIDSGLLRVPDGRIELAGVSAPGVIGLNIVDNQFRLQFPNNIARSDIALTNGAIVNASGNSGGSIQVYGRTITVSEASSMLSNTLGSGVGGNLNVNASELVQLSDTTEDGINGLSTQLEGTGTAGDITIQTRRLVIQRGAQVSTGVFGTGTGGNLTVIATDSIEITDVLNNGFASGLFTQAVEGSSGNSGDLMIQTRQLRLLNGAEISSANFSNNGSGGDISLVATDSIEVSGFRGRLPSNLGTSAFGGDAGDLTIETGQLIIQNRGVIAASAFGGGTGGTLRIDARQLLMQNGAGLGATTRGEGDGGDLIISASDSVQVIGGRSLSILTVSSESRENTGGDAGDLLIHTGRLLLRDGAQISASTLGGGEGGNLTVVASDSVQVSGTLGVEGAPSGLFASTEGIGDAGDLTVQTRQLTIQNGGRVSVSAFGESSQGNGGRLIVSASDSVRVTGVADDGQRTSLLTAETEGTGNAGDLLINTGQLQVQNGATVSVGSAGSSRAGNLRVNTRAISLNNRANITAATEAGNGGNIELQIANSLRLHNNSAISASTQNGQGGNLNLNIGRSPVNLVQLLDNSQLSAQAGGNGDAGSINLNTRSLNVRNRSEISASTVSGQQGGNITLRGLDTLQVNNGRISASTQTGQAGNLAVEVSDSIQLGGSFDRGLAGLSVQATGDRGIGGDLTVRTNELRIEDRATISASTRSGEAGSVRINASDSIQLHEAGSISVEAEAGGTAGGLRINTGQLTVEEGSAISVSSPDGTAGNLNVTADAIQLDRGFLRADIGEAFGAEINLQLQGQGIQMRNGSRISAKAGRNATGGNVTISAPNGFVIAFPNENNDIVADAVAGSGGEINITAQGIFGLAERVVDSENITNDIDASSEFGAAGTVNLNPLSTDPTQGLVELPADVVDASNQIVQACPTGEEVAESQNEFVVTGRGGLPPTPQDVLSGEAIQVGLVTPEGSFGEEAGEASSASALPVPSAITEAQGWMVNEKGDVVLLAEAPVSNSSFGHFSSPCSDSENE